MMNIFDLCVAPAIDPPFRASAPPRQSLLFLRRSREQLELIVQEIHRCFPELSNWQRVALSTESQGGKGESWYLRLDLSLRLGKLLVFLPQSFLLRSVQQSFGHLSDEEFLFQPSALITAFLFHASERLEDYLNLSENPLSISAAKRVRELPPEQSNGEVFRCTWSRASDEFSIFFFMEEPLRESVLAQAEARYPNPGRSRIDLTPLLPLEFFVNWKLHSLDRLLTLRVGEVLLLQEADFVSFKPQTQNAITLTLASVEIVDCEIRFALSGEKTVNEKASTRPSGIPAKNILPNAEVSLGLLLGTLRMSVQQLIDLTPGSTFSVPAELPPTLSLLLGETPIAELRARKDEVHGCLLEVVSLSALEEHESVAEPKNEETIFSPRR